MAIGARCPACGKDYQLADNQAGQRVRCRVCRWEFEVAGRVETLEAVPADALAGRPPVGRRSDLYESLEPPAPRKRRWPYVVGGLALALALVFLGCGGATWVATVEANKALAQMQAKEEAAKLEAKQEKERADRERDRADKEKERAEKERDNAKKANDQARRDVERAANQGGGIGVEGGAGKATILTQDDFRQQLARLGVDDLTALLRKAGLDVEELRKLIPNLGEGLPAKLPDLGPVKDLDDALAKLKANDALTKQKALGWIIKNSPYTGQNKRRVLDAIEPLTNDDNPFVKKGAYEAREIVEQDL